MTTPVAKAHINALHVKKEVKTIDTNEFEALVVIRKW